MIAHNWQTRLLIPIHTTLLIVGNEYSFVTRLQYINQSVSQLVVNSFFLNNTVFPLLLDKELRETFGDRILTKDEEAFVDALSPGHILAFATGSSRVPAIGFHPTPRLAFIHDESKHLPIAHVCKWASAICECNNNGWWWWI